MKPSPSRAAFAIALAALGCGDAFRIARPTGPVPAAPSDATLQVRVDHFMVRNVDVRLGLGDGSALAVVLDIANIAPEPYNLTGASMSCLMEVSPDRPAETLSLMPAGSGEGEFRGGSLDDMHLATVAIPPGQARRVWVASRGYAFAGSDVPRRITISLPDARGRRVQLVIADPAHGQRWETDPDQVGIAYGIQNNSVFAPGLDAMAIAGVFTIVARAGPFFYDVGLTTGQVVQTRGVLVSETSSFQSIGVTPHLTLPFVSWGPWPAPRRLAVFVGGAALALFEIPHSAKTELLHTYSVLSVDGGIEFEFSAQAPAALPFPISFSRRPALPRLTLRAGYTHWFAFGHDVSANSGGYATAIRLAF